MKFPLPFFFQVRFGKNIITSSHHAQSEALIVKKYAAFHSKSLIEQNHLEAIGGEEIKEKGGKHSYRLMKAVEVEKIGSKISQFAPFDEDQTFREKVVYEQKMIGMFDNLSIELLRNLLLLRKTSIPVTPRTTSSC